MANCNNCPRTGSANVADEIKVQERGLGDDARETELLAQIQALRDQLAAEKLAAESQRQEMEQFAFVMATGWEAAVVPAPDPRTNL